MRAARRVGCRNPRTAPGNRLPRTWSIKSAHRPPDDSNWGARTAAYEPENGVVSRCCPWACRSEGQPVQDDFRRPRASYQEALDFTQANNRVLVDRVKSLGRVLRIGRTRRAVVVPLASGGSQEDNRVQPRRAAVATHPFGSPARPCPTPPAAHPICSRAESPQAPPTNSAASQGASPVA